MSKKLNQKGSASVLLLSSLFFLVIVFFVIYTASEVLLFKQRTSLAAEQASLVVTSVVLEQARNAVDDYDDLTPIQRLFHPKVMPRVNAEGPFETNDEFKKAFDTVVTGDLNSSNTVLKDLLHAHIDLDAAIDEAEKSVEKNKGSSVVMEINSSGQFEASVTNRYWLSIFNWTEGTSESALTEEEKDSKSMEINQKGLGPELAFLKALED